jgi:hypothetical protein
MYIVNIPRGRILKHLPSSRIIAEIGVFRGGFAAMIIRNVKFEVFHLIDPWGKDCDDEYVNNYRVTDDMGALYEEILKRYEREILSGSIIPHRDYSTEVAPSFPENLFDWVYIDGMHSYEAVYNDLIAFSPKIAVNGFILGHDFSNTRMGRVKKFGVIGAVLRFCREFDWMILLVTNEDAPSYVLTRKSNDSIGQIFLGSVLDEEGVSVIEIDEGLLSMFEQADRSYSKSTRRTIFRIGVVPDERRHPFI